MLISGSGPVRIQMGMRLNKKKKKVIICECEVGVERDGEKGVFCAATEGRME